MKKNHLVWLRNDLRLDDNLALSAACEDADASIYVVFLACEKTWAKHDIADIKKRFIYRRLKELKNQCDALNLSFLFFNCDSFDNSVITIENLIQQLNIDRLFYNIEYGENEKIRDEKLDRQLTNCEVNRYHDQVILPPGIKTQQGNPYTVFTPYKKQWLQLFQQAPPAFAGKPHKRNNINSVSCDAIILCDENPIDDLYPVTDEFIDNRLNSFCNDEIFKYQKDRDIPSLPGTSVLSPWLAIGALSPRRCLMAAINANKGFVVGNNKDVECWINELIWRDFYIHILDCFPRVSKHEPFKEKYQSVKWLNNEEHFLAWCEGRTGIPIIDAAMQQLVNTGWMHNRLRMITAMFLSKNLLIDWRKGEQFFMQHLIDGHLAANNGGWQWSASTGTDAAPYFRIFNPVTQSQRFDPDGFFIKSQLPELSALDKRNIHLPKEEVRQSLAPNYPKPIVDLKRTRQRAIDAFASC